MMPTRRLDPAVLASVVAPFEEVGLDLRIAVEDADGRLLAGTPLDPADAAPGGGSSMAAIQTGGGILGRVVLHGPAAGTDLARATARALAAALAAVAATAARTSDDPGHDPVVVRSLEEELAVSRRLQRSFVSLVPPDVPGYDIASHYEAAREVGGDFFDLFRLRRRGRPLSIVIADVTGKGIAAALLMAFSRPLLHAAIDHTRGPAEALERTNTILVDERRTGLFITALCARLDVSHGVLRLANAGHEPPLFIPGDGSPLGLVLGSGPLLGAFGRLAVPEVEAFLAPGDIVLFYTDGVTDARSPSGERFDEDRLLAAVERARGGTAHDVIAEIGRAVERFSGGAEAADDITIVAVGRHRHAPRRPRPRPTDRGR